MSSLGDVLAHHPMVPPQRFLFKLLSSHFSLFVVVNGRVNEQLWAVTCYYLANFFLWVLYLSRHATFEP